MDSLYSPVNRVNYTVENTRIGNMTDYDKLTLEVWTDGTISARDAVSLGSKILCDHLVLFTDLSDTVGTCSTVVEKPETQRDKVLEMTIEELDLSVRSFNCLEAGQYQHSGRSDFQDRGRDDEGPQPGP